MIRAALLAFLISIQSVFQRVRSGEAYLNCSCQMLRAVMEAMANGVHVVRMVRRCNRCLCSYGVDSLGT